MLFRSRMENRSSSGDPHLKAPGLARGLFYRHRSTAPIRLRTTNQHNGGRCSALPQINHNRPRADDFDQHARCGKVRCRIPNSACCEPREYPRKRLISLRLSGPLSRNKNTTARTRLRDGGVIPVIHGLRHERVVGLFITMVGVICG